MRRRHGVLVAGVALTFALVGALLLAEPDPVLAPAAPASATPPGAVPPEVERPQAVVVPATPARRVEHALPSGLVPALLTTTTTLGVAATADTGAPPEALRPAPEGPGGAYFRAGRGQFLLRVGETLNPYAVTATFLPPGDAVTIAPVPAEAEGGGDYQLTFGVGEAETVGEHRWRWTAPQEPGVYPLRVVHRPSGNAIRINAVVTVPAERIENGHLHGYRIGDYPGPARVGDRENYGRPEGFAEVTRKNRGVRVSPHFRLGQFICKQAGGWPKYVVLDPSLPLKLELALEALATAGFDLDTLFVMSGYRTPFYNRAIGNVPLSRHVYGDAADIFVDANEDGWMDDLTGDGEVDFADALFLAGLVEAMTDEQWYGPFVGGLGTYGPRSHRGPFVHVDTRGYRARWESR